MTKFNIELNRKTIALMAGIALALFVLFVLIQPLFAKVSTVSGEVKALDAELVITRNTLLRAKGINKDRHLLVRNEVSKAINEIIKIGTNLDVTILSTSPQGINKFKDSKYPVLPIHLEVQSQYKDLGLFMRDLEQLSTGVITIREFSIERNEELLPKVQTSLILEVHLEEGQDG